MCYFSSFSLGMMSLLFCKNPNQAERPFHLPYPCTPLRPPHGISAFSSSPASQWPLSLLSPPLTSLLIPVLLCCGGQASKIPVSPRGQRFLLIPWGCRGVVEQAQTQGGRAGPLVSPVSPVSLPLSSSQGTPSAEPGAAAAP